MTPAARVQAAIELLDAVIEAARGEGAPADRLIADYFRQRRYAGSKDRRAVRELVYAAIRICGEVPNNGRAAMLALAQQDASLLPLFDGSTHGPAVLAPGESASAPGVAPDWLMERLSASGISEQDAAGLMARAPLDVRVNTLKADRSTIELPDMGEHLAAPHALRFDHGTQVEQWATYKYGLIEIQDLGSQLACDAANVRPGETVVDLCAGAGGKSLALAAMMENQGRLIACDTDKRRLGNLPPRAERAGAGVIETLLLNPNAELAALEGLIGTADCVFVDAPCSGTGTWRRKPEAKWRLTPERLARYTDLQDHVLDVAAQLVRPGGRIIFVTCSLLDEEGAMRADAFLARHPAFHAADTALEPGQPRGSGTRLTPFHDGTDGFFVAQFLLPC